MIDYGTVKSSVCPEPMVIDEFSVWINTNIEESTETGADGEEIKGFQYQMIQYTKDEYIQMMVEKNQKTDQQVTEAQLALIELYEMMLV